MTNDPAATAFVVNFGAIHAEAKALRAEVERLSEKLDQFDSYGIAVANALADRDAVERLTEKLIQYDAYGITVASALADGDAVERLTRERDEAQRKLKNLVTHLTRPDTPDEVAWEKEQEAKLLDAALRDLRERCANLAMQIGSADGERVADWILDLPLRDEKKK